MFCNSLKCLSSRKHDVYFDILTVSVMMLPLVPLYIIVAFSGFHTRKAHIFCFKGAPCLHEAVLTQIDRAGPVSLSHACDLRQGLYGK